MKFFSKPAVLLTAAALITSCVSLHSSKAAIPFYSPATLIQFASLDIAPGAVEAKQHIPELLDVAKLRVATLLPRWRLEGGGVVAAASIDTTHIAIIDTGGRRAALPLNPAPEVFDIKVTYESPTAPTLHVGGYALVPTSRLKPRDVRLLADAINIVRLSGQ